jgi:hypothetical protein
MRAALANLDQGDFTEGHQLDRKWKVAKEMVGRRPTQEEAKRGRGSNEGSKLASIRSATGVFLARLDRRSYHAPTLALPDPKACRLPIQALQPYDQRMSFSTPASSAAVQTLAGGRRVPPRL